MTGDSIALRYRREGHVVHRENSGTDERGRCQRRSKK